MYTYDPKLAGPYEPVDVANGAFEAILQKVVLGTTIYIRVIPYALGGYGSPLFGAFTPAGTQINN